MSLKGDWIDLRSISIKVYWSFRLNIMYEIKTCLLILVAWEQHRIIGIFPSSFWKYTRSVGLATVRHKMLDSDRLWSDLGGPFLCSCSYINNGKSEYKLVLLLLGYFGMVQIVMENLKEKLQIEV